MLTVQRKTGFGGITFSFLRDGKLLAAHVPGLLLSQAVAKMYGDALPIKITCSNGEEIFDRAVMRCVVQGDAVHESERFVDMCILMNIGKAFAEVPLIALRCVVKPDNRAVTKVEIQDSTKLENFLLEQRDEIEKQSLYEMICDVELSSVRALVKFLGLPIQGGEEVEDHADQIMEVPRRTWEQRFIEAELDMKNDATLTNMASDAIFYMENKKRVDESLSFDDDEPDFDFESEAETFTEEFDGDAIEETVNLPFNREEEEEEEEDDE